MFRKKVFHERDGIPGQNGPYLTDWLKVTDLLQIARLEAEFFPEPLSISSLIKLWLMPITYYIVVRKGRKVIAYIGFQMFEKAAHTISMGIHPDFRREGLAVFIQKTANRAAANRGARWFTGEVRVSNTPQLKFLEKLGWQQIGICPNFFKNGEAAVVVWNWLQVI
ncbi:MAG: N-acetyltransferase [Firmicutes bacterium HGW-Firmicutes-13]|nr:MAG: N-acetyltransferase [Firmicutes bacterium HGW-Firmicutes-13]